ncbi:MAG: flagellar filament capping protein FliD [Acidobacteria bacterium]|nr:flagellar filament capping protein FliD [Acidobacteriota bacterium]
MSTSSVNLTNSVLDVGSIVDNLIYLEREPVRNMESQVSTLQKKVTAYQTLNTRLSTLSDKVNTLLFGETEAPLTTPYSFSERLSESIFARCKVASSDEDKITATASNATTIGDYSITVGTLAQAKTMASSGFADTTSASLGTGTFIITTGANDPVTLTINSTNNTLAGLRDAINNADAGVTASIINDGSSNPYRLLITSEETGTANAFTVTDNLSGGQALSFAQTQAAADAAFVVNGVSISQSSNTVSDVIDGIAFTLKDTTTGTVTLSVEKDVDAIVSAISEMVSAYNAVNTFINGQFTYNSTTETAGVLSGDSTLRRIQSNLQSQLTQTMANRFTDYRVIGQIGIDLNRDGSLSLNESEFREALSDDFTSVAALFLGEGASEGSATASDSRVTYSGKTAATQPGTYAVQIDTLAQQASAVGSQTVDSMDYDETLTITYGTATAIVDLLQNDMLVDVLLKINDEFSAQSMAITAADDGTGKIKITTNGYGSSQTVTVVSDLDGILGTTGFGTTPVIGTGTDIAGSIGGNAATGDGLTLTGASGQPEEGLALTIAQTTTGSYGTVTVSPDDEGVDGASFLVNLCSLLDGLTDPLSGPIQTATDGLNSSIKYLNESISSYEDRLEIRKELLTAEFSKADEALRLMTVTQASLSAQISSLSQ